MYRIHQIKLKLKEPKSRIPEKILKKIGDRDLSIKEWKIVKESLDARDKGNITWTYSVDFEIESKSAENSPKQGIDPKLAEKLQKLGIDEAPTKKYELPKIKTSEPLTSRPVVVGFGPGGIFASLILAQVGLKPIVIERGKNTDDRIQDVEKFWNENILDEESNVQFGEGGAGAFSDGKLTTGIKDIRIKKVLEEFVRFGAPDEILYKQKPHIGTDLLRVVVKNIREEIIRLGGEIRFGTKLTNLLIEDGRLVGIEVEKVGAAEAPSPASEYSVSDEVGRSQTPCHCDEVETGGRSQASCHCDEVGTDGRSQASCHCDEVETGGRSQASCHCDTNEALEKGPQIPCHCEDTVDEVGRSQTSCHCDEVETGGGPQIPCQNLILSIGHSARDTFEMLNNLGVSMEQKPFSIGVRIEHPQDLIDKAQYGKSGKELGLPPAEYKVNYRCKGDELIDGRGVYSFCMCPGGQVITASSEQGGLVVNGMSLHARNSGKANSALLCDVRKEDFGSDDVLAGVRFQQKYEGLAYRQADRRYAAPACTWGAFRDGEAPQVEGCLPEFAVAAMRQAMPELAKKLRGFDDENAKMYGVETRSSSPVRILRGVDGQSISVEGLYPCGEGAGYAGGITSAAVDGIKIAEAVISDMQDII